MHANTLHAKGRKLALSPGIPIIPDGTTKSGADRFHIQVGRTSSERAAPCIYTEPETADLSLACRNIGDGDAFRVIDRLGLMMHEGKWVIIDEDDPRNQFHAGHRCVLLDTRDLTGDGKGPLIVVPKPSKMQLVDGTEAGHHAHVGLWVLEPGALVELDVRQSLGGDQYSRAGLTHKIELPVDAPLKPGSTVNVGPLRLIDCTCNGRDNDERIVQWTVPAPPAPKQKLKRGETCPTCGQQMK